MSGLGKTVTRRRPRKDRRDQNHGKRGWVAGNPRYNGSGSTWRMNDPKFNRNAAKQQETGL